MDIQRPDTHKRRIRRLATLGLSTLGFVLLAGVAAGLAQRPPAVDASVVWDGRAQRAEFVYEVTGAGTLYAPEIRSVTTRNDGVVERVHVLGGHAVTPEDVLIELSSPNLQEELAKARNNLEAAEIEELLRQAEAEDAYLNLLVTLAAAEAAYTTAELESGVQERLVEARATSTLEAQRVILRAEQEKRRYEAAQAQVARWPETSARRDAAAAAKLEQTRREVALLEERVHELHVRAGFSGVIQEIKVEAGQRISAGSEVARIVNPNVLIARVRVSERDAALVEVGQPVRLEMGRRTLSGEVSRVEPTVRDRLVTVDVELTGKDTSGLRPDLTVTARIEIDRAAETLVLDRPAGLRDDQRTADLFVLDANGSRARRVNVAIGRISPRQVEITAGLQAGDRVILADMSEWLEENELRIR